MYPSCVPPPASMPTPHSIRKHNVMDSRPKAKCKKAHEPDCAKSPSLLKDERNWIKAMFFKQYMKKFGNEEEEHERGDQKDWVEENVFEPFVGFHKNRANDPLEDLLVVSSCPIEPLPHD